jgi:eukaryotic-like serine/threonine-protein kinase
LLEQPTTIGKYAVLDTIGRGGMGVVYKARDPQLDRLVAIKMIIGVNPGLLKRFDVEARSTARLQHQNIVTIYDFGNQEGNPYLVMEYLEGMSLESVLSSGRALSLAQKLDICIGLCNGLNYAHERGVIHRDIKPANIMLLNDDNVKIVDFGIARIGDTGISRTEVVGSLHYMSPEQFQSISLDSRTDIFSAGVVLYRLLTGTLPFDAAGEAAIMYRIINEPVVPVSSYGRGCSPELDAILEKALAKNREKRYGSCREFAFDLQAVQEQQKHTEVIQWLQQADAAIQRNDWAKAEDHLKQLLKVDKNHTKAHRMMGEVQERVRQLRRVEQARQLRTHADEAFLDRRYDEALAIVAQAIDLDATNKDLLSLRSAIQEAKSRAVRLHSVLRQAELAQQAGDLDEAQRAVGEALALDPHETSAKALQLVILRQAQERERQQKLRQFLDSARERIEARDVTRAFEMLKAAETVDPASLELHSLLKVANAVREQQARKAELQILSAQIEEALARQDYDSALAVANQGLQRHPQDQGLLKLKALSEAEQRRLRVMAFAREQFALANGLLEAGKTFDALAVLEKALEKVPGESQLQSLRSTIKNRLTLEEAEQHKGSVLARARELLSRNDFREGIRLLEAARTQFPEMAEIEDMLRTARKTEAREKLIAEVMELSGGLFSQKGPDAVAEFLEKQVQVIDDPRLQARLAESQRQAEQLRRRLQTALQEGQRILREHGTEETRKYLEAQPANLLRSAEFRAFVESVGQQEAWESLNRDLAKHDDPVRQIQLCEEAVRRHPRNKEIQNRLAATRQRKRDIESIIDRAGVFETSREYSEAAQQLSILRNLYPKYPNLEDEIRRLQRLEEQQRNLAAKLVEAKNVKQEPTPVQVQANDALATRILQPRTMEAETASPSVNESYAPVLTDVATIDSRTVPALREVSKSRKKWFVVGCMVVLIVGVGIAWVLVISSKQTVRIDTDPPATSLAIDGRPCKIPCAPHLATGSHAVEAHRAGYLPFSQTIQVQRGGPSSFTLPLTAEPLLPSRSLGGTIAVEANVAGAEILVDGSVSGQIGRDKRASIETSQGNHEVTVRMPGYKTSTKSVQVTENHQLNLRFDLETGKTQDQHLQVQGPSGAQVKVDRRAEVAIPSSGNLQLRVEPGDHTIEVELPGFQTWSSKVRVKAGEDLLVAAALAKSLKPEQPNLQPPPQPPENSAKESQPAPTDTFSVSPEAIDQGKTAELTWDTKNATEVTIDDEKVGVKGSKPVSPPKSRKYTLVAKGPGGTTRDEVLVNVSSAEPPKTAGPDAEKKAVREALERYRDAYESESLDSMKRIWPSIGKEQQKALKDAFNNFSAIRVQLGYQDQDIQVSGEKASVRAQQTLRYTLRGKVQPDQAAAVNIQLKRATPAGWVVDSVSGH